MATTRRKSPRTKSGGRPGEVRRGRDAGRGLRQLPPDLDQLASGRRTRLGTARHRDGIADPRIAGLVPGVANREARAVYEARTARLRSLLAGDPEGREAAVGRALLEARRLTLWRAGNLTGFDAWVEDVVGLEPARAAELCHSAAEVSSLSADALPGRVIALWLRTEAAVSGLCPGAEVEVAGAAGALELRLRLPLSDARRAVEALDQLGQSARALGRIMSER